MGTAGGRRQSMCDMGIHSMDDPATVFYRNDGSRQCRPCKRERDRRSQNARRAAVRKLAAQPYTPPPVVWGWQQHAACRGEDTDLFFDSRSEAANEKACAICSDCKVKLLCFTAHSKEPYGIFGGTLPEERGYYRGKKRTKGNGCP